MCYMYDFVIICCKTHFVSTKSTFSVFFVCFCVLFLFCFCLFVCLLVFFTVKSTCVTQRTIIRKTLFKITKTLSPFLHKTKSSNNSFTVNGKHLVFKAGEVWMQSSSTLRPMGKWPPFRGVVATALRIFFCHF